EALDVRAHRLAEAAALGGHFARDAAREGPLEAHPAAPWRAAEERAGCPPLRASRLPRASREELDISSSVMPGTPRHDDRKTGRIVARTARCAPCSSISFMS